MPTTLEALAHIGAGLSALVYSLLLLRLYGHLRLHARFGRLLLALGMAVGVKGLSWYLAPGPGWLVNLYMFWAGVFPLLAALFFETLLKRPLHFWAKLGLLVGTAFFGVAALTPAMMAPGHWSGFAVSGYMALAVAYLMGVTLGAWWQAAPGPQRSLYAAMLAVGVVAPAFIFTDVAPRLGLDVPRLGSVPALLLVYFGSYALHIVGQWRMALATRRLGAALLLSALAVGAVHLAAPLALPQALALAVTLVVGFVLLEPLRLIWVQQRADRSDLLFVRLGALPTHSLEALLEALGRWPELRAVALVEVQEAREAERQRLRGYFASHGAVADLGVLRRQRLGLQDHEALLAVEQLEHLMRTREVDYLACIGPAPLMLGVRFDPGVDPATYKNLLAVLALIADLVADVPRQAAEAA